MYLATTERSARSSFAECISSGDVEAHWLIDRERGGAGHGKIGLIEIGAGGTASLMPEANDEDMLFVLCGHGAVRLEGGTADIRDEQVIFIPAGNSLELRAGDDGLRLLLVHGGSGNVADLGGGRASPAIATPLIAEPLITRLDQIENGAVHKPELGFLHVAARWLVSAAASKSNSLVIGQSTFVRDAAHLLHKHDHADEFFYVFEGEGAHLVEGGEIAMKTGDVVFAPRGEWHGFRNKNDRPVRAIFGYFGVAVLGDAGYEIHEATKNWRG
jgi:mannose-6-phosphate isomerase-like protein (cupin superfamily)